MLKLCLGIAAAIGASTLYSLGVALQAMDAKLVPRGHHLRFSLVGQLAVRARWLLGTGMSILGWPLQVVALLLAPLVVVQPALAAGLILLMLVGERMLGERPSRRDYAAIGAIVIGVVGIAACAPMRSTTHSDPLSLTLVLVGLGLLTLVPYLALALGRPLAILTMIGAGLGFAWSGVATKLASDDLSQHHVLVAAAWGLSTAGASAIGALSEMSALQARPAIQVSPVVFVTQTLVPVLLAPLLLGESFARTPAHGVPLVAALALVVAGATALARSPALLALMAGEPEPVSDDSGTADSRRAPSIETSRTTPRSDEDDPSTVTTTTSPARTMP